MFAIYKKGQGKYTRLLTMIGGGVVAVLGGQWLWTHPLAYWRGGFKLMIAALIVAAWILLGLWLSFLVSYAKPKTGDFFIATEGEMKKVSWSSRKEIIGSTQVVIFTLVFMGVMLFVVDVFFMFIFDMIGVLKGSPIKSIFTGAG
ncbi:MAG: Protein translocase subunit SecE [Phycisphaerae bacterium]|nr:Protein translocase subunit SecE [Phycisphaerae bacterium]